jgi:hypothetical protein
VIVMSKLAGWESANMPDACRESHDHPLTETAMLEEEYLALHRQPPPGYQDEKDLLVGSATANEMTPGSPESETFQRKLKQAFYAAVHRESKPPAALCLSGGGIRSATFNLGVLQALARHKLLTHFDYLSTVSGGGYVGSWLTAWMHRESFGLQAVVQKLAPSPETCGAEGARGVHCKQVERDPVRHLREYSNYLTPHSGLLRLDSATLIATYARNLLLNWLVLVPLILAVLLVPRLYLAFLHSYTITERWQATTWLSIAQALVLLALGAPAFIAPSGRFRRPSGLAEGTTVSSDLAAVLGRDERGVSTRWVMALVILPLCLSALMMAFMRAWIKSDSGAVFPASGIYLGKWRWGWSALSWATVFIAAPTLGYVINRHFRQKAKLDPRHIGSLVVAGVIASVFFRVTKDWGIFQRFDRQPLLYASLQIPYSLTIYFVLVTVQNAFVSTRPGGDHDREWWARVLGWLWLISVIWLAVATVAIAGPWLVNYLWHRPATGAAPHATPDNIWAKILAFVSETKVLALASAITTLIGVISGFFASKTDEKSEQRNSHGLSEKVLDALPQVFAAISIPLIFLFAAVVLDRLMSRFDHIHLSWDQPNAAGAAVQPLRAIFIAIAVAVAVIVISGWCINFNRFSLHAVYRDRLIRAFLGASNVERQADLFTGFDPDDNIPLHHLRRGHEFMPTDLPTDERVLAAADEVLSLGGLGHPVRMTFRENDRRQTMYNELETAVKACRENRREAVDGRAALENVSGKLLVLLNDLLSSPTLHIHAGITRRNCTGDVAAALDALGADGSPRMLNRLILEHKLQMRGSTPRPLHVLNMALNLVDSKDLARQQRKAASFTATPLHCGFSKGYRRSVEYGGPITLGTAMTISGAAASPNMGYHSSPTVTFLLTLFNVRLGWWLGNPGQVRQPWFRRLMNCIRQSDADGERRHAVYRRSDPRQSTWPIINEALGRTNDEFSYVYLSDGGHFENLGLYEMVRRRCKFIVVSDASCDPECKFDDLTKAIERVQNDMGIHIEMRDVNFYPGVTPIEEGRYCAVGTIHYEEVDDVGKTPPSQGKSAKAGPGRGQGFLLYIKPALHVGQPLEVCSHGRTSDAFPHEPTSNQFFSESQFESYRRLGFEIMDHLCSKELENDVKDLAELRTAAEKAAKARRTQSTPQADLTRQIDELLKKNDLGVEVAQVGTSVDPEPAEEPAKTTPIKRTPRLPISQKKMKKRKKKK